MPPEGYIPFNEYFHTSDDYCTEAELVAALGGSPTTVNVFTLSDIEFLHEIGITL